MKKLTDIELKQIQDIQNKYDDMAFQIGQIELSIINLNLRKREIEQEYSNLKSNELKLLNEITSKYGEGTLNYETGEIK